MNLAGQLKRVVDPFNAQIDYTYDQAGRLSSITGTPFGNAGVTQYATDMRYRAWGGLKHLNYGNNPLQLNLTYTARLQVDTIQVGGIQTLQSDYCPPGQHCMTGISADHPCNTWPNGCWDPPLENPPLREEPTVRAPTNPSWIYYYDLNKAPRR